MLVAVRSTDGTARVAKARGLVDLDEISEKVQRRRAARLDFFDFLAGVSLWRRGQLGLFRLLDFFQRGSAFAETRLFDFSKKSKSQPAARTRPSLAASAAGLTFFFDFSFLLE